MAPALHVSAVPPSAVTLVTQTRVSPSHDEEFARWQEQVNHALEHFPGYLDHTVLPPHPPAQVDWVVVQRFASHETARAWAAVGAAAAAAQHDSASADGAG